MRRRLTSLLLVLVAIFGLSVSAGQLAAADDGIVDGGIEVTCQVAMGPLGLVDAGADLLTGSSLCDEIGDAGAEKVDEAWEAVRDSVLGDIIESCEDVARWVIKKTLTVALLGPSVDLRATGLWGGKPSIAGMMTWLGLVIAVAGVMWQLAKMALTGQVKHAGRTMTGWIENLFLSTCGVAMFALLLVLGDTLSAGVVNFTFDNNAEAYERIVKVLLPAGIANPVTMLGVVQVLLLIGFIQLIMIFLRQSAIPIVCVLLPVAGGGRTGGDTTRKWAPALITSGLVIIAYKPMVAIIICIGFAEFGESQTLAEWLRGVATLLLAILAPGPLTKIFAPFGAAAGAGMSAGGASGALAGAAGYFAGRAGGDSGRSGDGQGDGPTTPVQHAQMVNQTMGSQSGGGEGEEDGQGGDVQAQVARNQGGTNVPTQRGSEAVGTEGAVGGPAEGATGAAETGAAAGAGGTASAAAGPVAVGIQVLDGVNDVIQGASGAVGGGDRS